MIDNIKISIEKFLNSCPSVDIYDYTLNTFVIHVLQKDEFKKAFKKYNQDNGVDYVITELPGNMFALNNW